MPYCRICGQIIEDDSVFCGNCGTPVKRVDNQIVDSQEDHPGSAIDNADSINDSNNEALIELGSGSDDSLGSDPIINKNELDCDMPPVKQKTSRGLIVAVVALSAVLFSILIFVGFFFSKHLKKSNHTAEQTTENNTARTIKKDASDNSRSSVSEIILSSDPDEESETPLSSEPDEESEKSITSDSDGGAETTLSLESDEKDEIQPISMDITAEASWYEETQFNGKCVFEYDGDQLSKVSLYINGDFIEDVVLEYDDRGNRILDYSWWFNDDGLRLNTWTCEYDSSNFKVQTKDGIYITKYTNDSNGNPIHIDHYETNNGNPELYMTDDKTYDELNRCISMHRVNIGGAWTEDYTYCYSGNNKEPDSFTCINDVDGESNCSFTYKYNSRGQIIEKKEELSYQDNNFFYTTIEKYKYE